MTELPSNNLRLRVSGKSDDKKQFINYGKQTLKELKATLSLIGTTFTDYPRALDFGCGCARTLRHLKSIGKIIKLHGTDIDAEAIDWDERLAITERCVNTIKTNLSFGTVGEKYWKFLTTL